MINYHVQPGDTIGVLAVKYKTTIRILMSDNPFIGANQKLQVGWKLKIYTPEENAKRHSETAYEQIERSHKLKDTLETNKYILSTPREPVYYKDREVLEGQIAFVRTLTETPLMEVQANGFIKRIRDLPKGEILRVYESTTYNNGMYLVNNHQWITANPDITLYDEIPQYNLDGKIDLRRSKIDLRASALANPDKYSNIGLGTPQKTSNYLVSPQSMIGSGTIKKSGSKDGIFNMPQFERPAYRRPVLVMKNAAGETKNVELRVLGFQASYANDVQPSSTNSGWMINIRGGGLPVLSISGFLLETKTANEFNDFMTRYHQYLKASKSGDYYSMGISTLFYKKTEYRGIVTSFSYSDREEESLHRKYTLSMLILKEKNMDSTAIAAVPKVVDRKGLSEAAFRSDIGAMLANAVTGKYTTDFSR